ncbi:MAG: hypothetical protein A2057_03810 [Ignavibacteria bacterium GWA2_35_9]|nr:MAG: hypothetical protein A2057_03810 [Ignavibacteria bacterium GWA2_35_9]
MKRFLRFSLLALFTATLVFPQKVVVKRVAKSPADIKLTPWVGPVSTGLKVLGKGSTAYFVADTTGSGATAVTSFAWSITSKPGGSSAAFDTTDRMDARFKPDVVGQYIVSVSVNGGAKTAADTIFASTFMGSYATPINCGTCHSDINTGWQETNHATSYKRGLTGMWENSAATGFKGVLGSSCIKCHTTGWDDKADNGNFGFTAHATGWDTTWYKGATASGSSYLISYDDQSRWDLLGTAPYASVKKTATIGCESCHGAGTDHMGDKTKIGKSVSAGVCMQCHDSPTHHMVGSSWKESSHATMPLSGSRAGSTGCYPCHSGAAFVKFVDKKTNLYNSVEDNVPSISCATCHDPHSAANHSQLRTVTLDSLRNGIVPPTGIGGKGLLCMNCHNGRYNSKTQVDGFIATFKTPGKAYPSRIYPHYNAQADMYFGQNAYDFGVTAIQGVMTHDGVENSCVSCHMSQPLNSTVTAPDHSMHMSPGGVDKVTACRSCHGNINSFEDIKGSDYDGDGTVEGTMVEVDGLMEKLADLLPKDADGAVTELANSAYRVADSTAIANGPYQERVFPGIWNYYFVAHDWSHGVHNAKYAVQLLNYTIQYVKTGVVPVELTSFTSSISNGVVTLQWQTATEKNNKGFEVQRKIGTKWETISFVNGRGTSTEINKYSYSDNLSKLNVAGNISYRLRQVDFDGTSVLTKEVNVNFTSAPKSFSLSQNYPNPFNPSTTIRFALPFDSNVKISIYKVTGELVKVLLNGTKTAGNYDVTMNTARENVEFSSGIYFYSIEANAVDGSSTFKQTKKMILLK